MLDAVNKRFEERQSFGPIFHVVIGISALSIVIAEAMARSDGRMNGLALDLLIAVLVVGTLWNLSCLRTYVADDHVRVAFGALIPYFWKRIPLSSITACRAVAYRPLLDAGGWGIRFGLFEGQTCRYYNARGKLGVLLEIDGKRCIIGSLQPEELAAAICAAARDKEGRTL